MLFEITEQTYPVVIDLRYGTSDNVTHKPIYKNSRCFLRNEAKIIFEKAVDFATAQNLRFKIFDAFRPKAAQQCLWDACPDETFVANPQKGSNHTRGIAIDLTLIDQQGTELDMGTPFDDFTDQSFHTTLLTPEVQKNRFMLLGIMMSAGWDFYDKEWWHYQMFDAKSFDLIENDHGMMT
jgi:D-alanyl-D-alanine dipeptidase